MRMAGFLTRFFAAGYVFLSLSTNEWVVHAYREPSDANHAFSNFTHSYLSFLDDLYSNLKTNHGNDSEKCRTESEKLLDLVSAGDSNALKVLDSSGKPSSGLLEGGVYFIGFYSECVNAVVKISDDSSFSGKYCLLNLEFPETNNQKDIIPEASWLVFTQSQKPPTIGVCIPSSCSENDLAYASTVINTDDDISDCTDLERSTLSLPTTSKLGEFLKDPRLWKKGKNKKGEEKSEKGEMDAAKAREKKLQKLIREFGVDYITKHLEYEARLKVAKTPEEKSRVISEHWPGWCMPLINEKCQYFYKIYSGIATLCVLLLFVAFAIFATILDCLLNTDNSKTSCCGNGTATTASTEVLCGEKTKKHSKAMQCVLAFSLTKSAKKLFTVENGAQNIKALHGLRFLSMTLIIFGHTYSFASQNLYFRNPRAAAGAPSDFSSQLFANGTFAVDTFYFISGLLVAYVSLKLMDKLGGNLNFLYFYLHRYFRLTPVLLAVILFCAYLLRYVGSGPNWLFSIQMYDVWCKKNGWLIPLYLHNFINTEEMCLSHTWYLATDMQIYIIVPIILIPLYKKLTYGIISMVTLLFITILTTAVLTVVHHYPAVPYINSDVSLGVINDYYKNVYIKPYCRMGPYIVGIAVGYYLLHKKELPLSRWKVAVMWILSIALCLTIIYLMWPANQGYLPSDSEAAAYSSLSRTLWGIGVGWLIVACYYGYGGFVNKLLSWSPLIPMSRLTYCAYLIHPVIMNAYYGSTETTVDFSNSFIIYMFLGNFSATYVLSIIISLLFEYPFVALEKAALTRSSS
ncbi:nose resistant to fluoxetine protein 6-like [Stegodyphus dumicola]|uniref:nose resistant to fluoxetine protein 6-like n=1 Tax=Stegodyphus dumicola TaxID=202533 RepID=UPI0015B123FA|nr:nose resistant to fluoxetine protein 6-like [Stegodyphus dumicola]